MTTLGYRIVPVIARVKPGFSLTLNTGEVDATFEVPLAFLMDQANVQRHSRDWQGMTRHYYAHHLRRALHLGRDRWYPAQSVRTDLSMRGPSVSPSCAEL